MFGKVFLSYFWEEWDKYVLYVGFLNVWGMDYVVIIFNVFVEFEICVVVFWEFFKVFCRDCCMLDKVV